MPNFLDATNTLHRPIARGRTAPDSLGLLHTRSVQSARRAHRNNVVAGYPHARKPIISLPRDLSRRCLSVGSFRERCHASRTLQFRVSST